MKRLTSLVLLALLVLALMVSCAPTEDSNKPDKESTPKQEIPAPQDGEFVLTGIVNNITDRIEIEVINSDYAYGIYWVLIAENTAIYDANGQKIGITGIEIGDTVDIVYGGQVMMSCPPQIVAHRVTVR